MRPTTPGTTVETAVVLATRKNIVGFWIAPLAVKGHPAVIVPRHTEWHRSARTDPTTPELPPKPGADL
jgi:hypothetical protein